jgi:gliding motility-associated-like protein
VISGSAAAMVDGQYTDNNYISISGSTPTTLWAQFQAATPYLLSSYSLTSSPSYQPTGWTLSGSNDGNAWTDMDTRSGQSFTTGTPQYYQLTGVTVAYSYYRITFTTTQSTSYVVVSELELFSATAAPAAPVLNVTAISGTEAGASWNSLSLPATDSFYLERSTDGTNYSLLNTVPGTTLSYLDQTLQPSTTFYYRLRAKNVATYSPYSNAVQITTSSLSGQSADITNDGGSLFVSAENTGGANSSEGSVHFIDNDFTTKWLVFTSTTTGDVSAVYRPTGHYVVTGYVLTTAGDAPPRDPKNWVFQGSNDSTNWVQLDMQSNQLGGTTPRTTSYTYILSSPGTISYKFYRWNMTANNGATDGVRLQIAEWQILGVDINSPNIPQTLAVGTTTNSSIDLSWTESTPPAVTNFVLQRGTDGRSFTTVATLPGAATSYTDNAVYDSTTYYYRIQAQGAGTAISGYSNVATGTTGFTPGVPLAPHDLQINLAIDSVIGMIWTDHSYNETGFKVQRSTDGTSFSDLVTLPANSTAFNDSTVWPAIKYYYRVYAFDSLGTSAYSNIDSAMTTGFNHPPILAAPELPQNICSNTASYSFTLGGLTPGPTNESSQSMTVTSLSFDKPQAFNNVTYTQQLTDGAFTLSLEGAGAMQPGDTATATITVKDNGGTANVGTDSLQLTFAIVYQPLSLTISSDKDTNNIIRYQTVHLTAVTNYASTTPNYNWDAADGIESGTGGIELTVRPTKASQTTYTVHATSESGCMASASVTLKIGDQSKIVGNVLTPNGDGINDKWVIWGIEKYPNNTVKVFDRAGRLIFIKNHYGNDWDGTTGGKSLAEGLYYYVVDLGDGSSPMTGTLNVIKAHN